MTVEQSQATASVRALMAHLIDYAGLFPPAKLDMQPTVDNYAKYIESDDAWMLGRLIVPVKRLGEFESCAKDLLTSDEPWRISALTAPAGSEDLAADLERIETFNAAHADRNKAIIDVIELKANSAEAIDHALDAMPDAIYPYFEIPVDADPRGLITTLAGNDAGAKIRTGGITPDLHPTPAQVARFLDACAACEVPFKATAGLHHPLRHHSQAVGCDQFGFLNIFIGALVAIYAPRNLAALEQLLTEQSADAFTFTDDGITIADHTITTDQIEDARLAFAVSYGSCSFDEPREDLRNLRIL